MGNLVLDRVNEAYSGLMGEEFSKETRRRINWIVNHTKGDNILDIGCSQGIVPIILGREGKKVLGIDIVEASINYAKEDLKREHETVQNNVTFVTANFITYTGLSDKYDTVLLTEVLEHIADTKSFLKKISLLLNDDSNVVITVPFGINDYFDHKRTYYFLELFEQLDIFFNIEKFEYLGKWTGVVCRKKTKENFNQDRKKFDRDIISELEKAFYKLENDYVSRIKNYLNQITDKNKEIKKLKDQEKRLEEKYVKQLEELNEEVRNLKENNKNYLHLKEIADQKMIYYKELYEVTKTFKDEYFEKSSIFENYLKITEGHWKDVNNQILYIANEQMEINRIYTSQEKEFSKIKELIVSNSNLIQSSSIDNKNIEELMVSIKHLMEEIESNRIRIDNNKILEIKKSEYTNTIKELSEKIEKLKKTLATRLDSEEEVLGTLLKEKQQFNELQEMNKRLNKDYLNLEKKYNSLKNSKLGRLTLWYWKYRRKMGKKGKKI